MLAILDTFVLAILLQGTPKQSAAPAAPIPHRLDGRFDDWATLDPVSTRHDKTGDAKGSPDITLVSLASDEHDFWILIEFAKPVTLQGLDKPLILLVDADGNPKTGTPQGQLPGADFVIVFSPDPADVPKDPNAKGPRASKEHGEGVQVRLVKDDGAFAEPIAADTIGLGMAPAHASRRFELRIPRTAQRFGGVSAGVLAAFREKLPDGSVQWPDEVDPARCLLAAAPPGAVPKAAATSVARADGTTMRVASWNAELGAIFRTPEPFGATLKAIAPDVVLFQELGATAKAEELASWMNTNVGPGSDGAEWHALVSGGDLRTGVVARRPLANAPFLDGVQRKTPKGDRSVRVVGAVVDIDGRQLLLASLHLKCCGRFESTEDESRLAEATAIHDAIRQAQEKLSFAGVVVAGDFNLVGDPGVLDRTAAGLDVDGSPLDPVDAYQLDGLTNATWRSTGDRFVPGRLDWALVSGASLKVARSFVFSTEDLSAEAVASLKLPDSALKEPSDHMPLVFDLVLTPAPAQPKPTEAVKP